MRRTPRPYQSAAVTATWNFLQYREGNPCIVIPTGGGKSIVIATLCEDALTQWPGTRICILAHVQELVGQNYDKLKTQWPEAPAGIYAASLNRRDRFNPIIFASIQSVAKRAATLGWFDLLLIDEAHRIPLKDEGLYRMFINACLAINPRLRIVGLTATDYRLGGGPIVDSDYILTHKVYEARIGDLVREGYLCRLTSKAGNARADMDGMHIRNGDYVQAELQQASNVEAIVNAACDEMVERCADRHAWIVFAAGAEHAESVTAKLIERGIAAASITDKTATGLRRERIAKFQNRELRALVNVNILSEGFDAPHIDAVVLMRRTQSAALYYQQVGRGMRLFPGKADCLVLDFTDNVERLGPVDAIVGPKRPGDKAKGEATLRQCPECNTYVPVQTRTCACGHEFPIAEESAKHNATASDAPIMSDEIEPVRPTIYNVVSVDYSVHKKKGRPDTFKVAYFTGMRTFYVWVHLEHGGEARARAMGWWMLHDRVGLTPRTVADAMLAKDRLRKPVQILVSESGKYPEVIDYAFDESRAA